ncbi:hypothetical protein A3Q56_05113 [Intoshia linei]|uniref:CRIM domain-containing protein n=1 Tax=Intoshia linei TaxID=1819745 RepID=A0A177AYS2_9BILA|nr:hypothetical protein A3Q56_05113 [Intoshia linei]
MSKVALQPKCWKEYAVKIKKPSAITQLDKTRLDINDYQSIRRISCCNGSIDEKFLQEYRINDSPKLMQTLDSKISYHIKNTLLFDNPFKMFSLFDAEFDKKENTDRIKVYFDFDNYSEPIILTISKLDDDVTVYNVIGLACFRYVNDRKYKFSDVFENITVDELQLYIAEDDGSIEIDFPSIEPTLLCRDINFDSFVIKVKPIPKEHIYENDTLIKKNYSHVFKEFDGGDNSKEHDDKSLKSNFTEKAFSLKMFRKYKPDINTILSIYKDKIVIDRKNGKQKRHFMDQILTCSKIEKKSTKKIMFFRIGYKTNKHYKQYEFFAEFSMSQEILDLIRKYTTNVADSNLN